jgi:hypothetical protein
LQKNIIDSYGTNKTKLVTKTKINSEKHGKQVRALFLQQDQNGNNPSRGGIVHLP